MSGILAVFNRDGAPVDERLLARMTAALAHRGPDEQRWWCAGPIGLGFAGLNVFVDEGDRGQPASLDGRFWIVADARIDAQAELRQTLGLDRDRRFTDAQLILHAYRQWGTEAPAHLVGDFAFLLWDAEERRLFCACDQAGIRQLYWTQAGQALVIGNSFPALLEHPGIARTPDARAMADYLQHGCVEDDERTCLEAVKHVSAATAIIADREGVRTGRYWEPAPQPPKLRFRHDEELIEQFRERLLTGLRDRMRAPEVTILMSGGLDSTALAALAVQSGASVRAITIIHYPEIDDREELRLAQMTAGHLGIELEVVRGTDGGLLDDVEQTLLEPWPMCDPMNPVEGPMSAHGRITISGFDGDIIFGLRSVSEALLARRDIYRMAEGLGTFLLYERRLPVLHALRYRRSTGLLSDWPVLLRKEWRRTTSEGPSSAAEWPLACIGWRSLMQQHDATWAFGVEHSHPFGDIRLVEFCRSLPAIPWRVQKRVLREAMKGMLPAEVLRRPKTPLPGDAVESRFKRDGLPTLDRRSVHPLLEELLDWDQVRAAESSRPMGAGWALVRAHLAQRWLSLAAAPQE